MHRFKPIYSCLKEKHDQLSMITIFANLAFLKDIHSLVFKNQKILTTITDIFTLFHKQPHQIDIDLLTSAIHFLANISHNPHFHAFITSDEILEVLSSFFKEPQSDQVELKLLIRKILANVSFSHDAHEALIKHNVLTVFDFKKKTALNMMERTESMDNSFCGNPANNGDKRFSLQNEKNEFMFTGNNSIDRIREKEGSSFSSHKIGRQIDEGLSKEALICLINLGLNPLNFPLVENIPNIITSLNLIEECDKPLQIKLLETACHYFLGGEYNSAKKKLFSQIIKYCLKLLREKSNYLIKNITYMLPTLFENENVNEIEYDAEGLISELLVIIIKHENNQLKKLNLQTLFLITRNPNLAKNFNNIEECMEKLFNFADKKLKKMEFSKGLFDKNDFIVIFFQKIMSNFSLYWADNREKICELLSSKEFDEFMINSLRYGKNHNTNILLQTVCTYGNLFLNKKICQNYNFCLILNEIHQAYRKIGRKIHSFK